MRKALSVLIACVALVAMGISLLKLHDASTGLRIEATEIGTIPARVYQSEGASPAPVVVIAHGFAGSQQLMQSFAMAIARNGYIAVTFDFAGHGRNPSALTGSITEETGATQTLMAETAKVVAAARDLGDGRIAVLGHSMASDIVVRLALTDPTIAATIAVSMFSPVVTDVSPRNLLVIVGNWEGMLKTEALRAVGLSSAPKEAEEGVLYGDPSQGTGRLAVFTPNTEHVSVLFSLDSMQAAVQWLDKSFGMQRTAPLQLDARGPWIALLIAGAVVLARPLAKLLPRVSSSKGGAGLGWKRLSLPLVLPALITPLLLRVLPTHFLPVLVADYLAVHFAMYGLLTVACLLRMRQQGGGIVPRISMPFILASFCVIAYEAAALFWPLDHYFTNFIPGLNRLPILLAMMIGTLLYFISDEWLTRGEKAERGAYTASKVVFLVSLAIATALDFERLFFLVIIIPLIVLFFLIFGLFSAWIYKRTGDPLVAGLTNALSFAWAIGVTFPILAG
jgi:pimeloyl-ACP methyl ester carboxylesterase